MNEESADTSSSGDASAEDPSPRPKKSWWRRFGLRSSHHDTTVREALAELIDEAQESDTPIDAHERLLLSNIFHLQDVQAQDVMMPRADIVSVALDTSFPDLLRIMVDEGVSRMPVYRETLDDAMGLIHLKDAVQHLVDETPASLSQLIRPILYVAPTMRVMDLLLEMRVKRTHMALVVDEYGGVDGLVTIEDLVEEIVGEIEDEHDIEADPEMIFKSPAVLEADARVLLDDFEAAVGNILSDAEREDIDTVGGLVFLLAGHIPAKGELVPHSSGIEFQIMDADPRRIKRVRVRNLPFSAEQRNVES